MLEKANNRPFYMWVIAAFFYLYELVLRVSPSVMTGELVDTFGGTSTILGLLVSFYYYAYTPLQIPCGLILDRLGIRNLLGLSCLICAMGSILFGATNNLHIAQFGRFLVGAGSACAFITCLQIASTFFDKKYFVLLAGITNMMGTLGGLFGGMPVAKAVQVWGWQKTTYGLAFGGLVLCILTFFVFPRDTPKQKESSLIKDLLVIIKNQQIILPGIIASFMYLPVSAFAELWAVPYFKAKFALNDIIASSASAATFVGVAIGSVLMACLANKINSYTRTLKISIIFTILLFGLLLNISNFAISLFIVFLIGFFTGAQPICFTCAKNKASPELSGTTLAITNCIVMLMGCIFQPLLGLLLDMFWTNKLSPQGTRIYDVSCYNKAIVVIPIALIVAYIVSLFMKEDEN